VTTGLQIWVTSGTGEAPTELAAFDRALLDAGIANHNLIPLSSMIPRGAVVAVKEPPAEEAWGQVLYVVLAQQRESRVGVEAWAGLGWVQDRDTGRGMLVEHEAGSRHSVEAQIEASLESMVESRGLPFGPMQMATVGVTCHNHPVCALVVAVFGPAHPWDAALLPGNTNMS
jgi:arginine decarboxylase